MSTPEKPVAAKSQLASLFTSIEVKEEKLALEEGKLLNYLPSVKAVEVRENNDSLFAHLKMEDRKYITLPISYSLTGILEAGDRLRLSSIIVTLYEGYEKPIITKAKAL